MYIPKHFNETDLQKILNLIRQHAFGTLITSHNNIPMASHIPFLIEETQPFKLRGHLAYANEQWKHIQDDGSVMLIFQGPHTYISPRWYKNAGVPTWNYAMVHIYGKANILKAPDKLQNIVNGLTNDADVVLADTTIDGQVVNNLDSTVTILGTATFNDLVSGSGNFFGPGTAIGEIAAFMRENAQPRA